MESISTILLFTQVNCNNIHRGEAALRNTCANGILKNKSNKRREFLRGPRYNKLYWVSVGSQVQKNKINFALN